MVLPKIRWESHLEIETMGRVLWGIIVKNIVGVIRLVAIWDRIDLEIY